MEPKLTGNTDICEGNKAAAYGVLLCRPDVIAIYPITPQTSLIENIAKFQANGLLNADIVKVEGEISAIGTALGASLAGGRVFTASSSLGLYFMFDTYQMAGYSRLPIVMVLATRELTPPAVVAASDQDVMGVTEVGWVHLHTESCQEILDSIIMAYRLAEDPEILLPVSVIYEGFYLSYLTEPVVIPSQEDVDRFLPLRPRTRLSLDPPTAFRIGRLTPPQVTEYRYRHQAALERVKTKIDEIDKEFQLNFGRSYGGMIEEYRMEDAEIALLTIGSHTGTARVAADNKREQGIRVGVIKVRVFRPFPQERLVQALRGKNAIGVVDRSVCFGWRGGHLFRELQAAAYGSGISAPIINFIDGLAGGDITIEHLERAIDITYQASQGKPVKEVTWLCLE